MPADPAGSADFLSGRSTLGVSSVFSVVFTGVASGRMKSAARVMLSGLAALGAVRAWATHSLNTGAVGISVSSFSIRFA